MPVPSTNTQLSDIYWEAQFGGGSGDPGSPIVFGDLAGFDYFYGPNGSASISYNGWGQSTAVGNNKIYGLSNALSGPYLMSDFQNLAYFYDQVNYQASVTVYNNLGPPPPPPTPPTVNDIQDVVISFKDQSDTYTYLSGNIGNVPFSNQSPTTDISQAASPLIAEIYWTVEIVMDPGFGGGFCDFFMSGGAGGTSTSFFQPVSGGSNIFTWSTYGSVTMGNIGSWIGIQCVINIF